MPCIKILLLSTLLILPLLGAYGRFGYEQIKVLFFILSMTLIGSLWKGKGIKWTPASYIAGVFIIILLITSLTGVEPKNSLLGGQPYFQGWILYSYLYLFYLMIKTLKIDFKKYALVLATSAMIVSLLAIYDWILLNIFSQPVQTYAGRVVATFGQPNFYAGFLFFTLPFAYFLFKNSHKKWTYLGWGSGLIAVIAIFLSYSRSVILLTLLLLILGLIDQLKIKFKLSLATLCIIAISILLSLKFSSGFGGNEITKPISTANPDLTKESVEKRVYIWPVAWQIILQKPVLGYGLENIQTAFANYFQTNKHSLFEANLRISPVLISLKDLIIDRTHNYVLDLLLFAGFPGLISWLILVMLLFKKLIQKSADSQRNILIVSLSSYLIWIQFHNQSVVHLVYFWLLAGMINQPADKNYE